MFANLSLLGQVLLCVLLIAFGLFMVKFGDRYFNWSTKTAAGKPGTFRNAFFTLDYSIFSRLTPEFTKFWSDARRPMIFFGGIALIIIGTVRLLAVLMHAFAS